MDLIGLLFERENSLENLVEKERFQFFNKSFFEELARPDYLDKYISLLDKYNYDYEKNLFMGKNGFENTKLNKKVCGLVCKAIESYLEKSDVESGIVLALSKRELHSTFSVFVNGIAKLNKKGRGYFMASWESKCVFNSKALKEELSSKINKYKVHELDNEIQKEFFDMFNYFSKDVIYTKVDLNDKKLKSLFNKLNEKEVVEKKSEKDKIVNCELEKNKMTKYEQIEKKSEKNNDFVFLDEVNVETEKIYENLNILLERKKEGERFSSVDALICYARNLLVTKNDVDKASFLAFARSKQGRDFFNYKFPPTDRFVRSVINLYNDHIKPVYGY